MSSQTPLIMLLGALVGVGVLLVVIGMSEREEAPLRASRSLSDRLQGSARRALLGIGAGLVILLLTGWPVLGIAIGLLVWFAPMLFGGLVYSIGALVYAFRRPDPLPRVFGFHEVFHALVVCASIAFATAIWIWVVPYPRP